MTYGPPHPDGQPVDPNRRGDYPAPPSTDYPQPGPGFGLPPQAYGYAPPGYGYPVPGYGYPALAYGYPDKNSDRPSKVIAASVLAYILAGLLILAGILLVSVASSTSELYDTFNRHQGDITTEIALDGFVNFLAGGLLIAGAVSFTGGHRSGRVLLVVGNAISVAAGIYWLARTHGNNGALVWVALFGALAIVGICLAAPKGVGIWLSRRAAAVPAAAPYPR